MSELVMSAHSQRVFPYLLYENAAGALDWLVRVFGFHEHLRHVSDDGRVDHAEISVDRYVILLAQPQSDYRSKKSRGDSSTYIELVIVVDDVEEHFNHAKAEGARIIREPTQEPWGTKSYRVADLEGRVWEFEQPLEKVAPGDWGAIVKNRDSE